MSNIARLFQQQVPLDSKVKIFLTNGKEVVGTLDEISLGHITLRNNGKPLTILLNMIGGWEVIEDPLSQAPNLPVEEDRKEDSEYLDTQPPIPDSVSTLPENDTLSSSSDDLVNLQTHAKIIEINAYFQAHLQTANIEIRVPDFVFPAEEFQPSFPQVDTTKLWDRVINKYKYALKIKELSVTHGRLPNIINDLEELNRWYPGSPSVNRHLAYFYYLAGRQQNALENYKKAAGNTNIGFDWHNLAAIAIECGQEELAYYSLEQFFQYASIVENLNNWYLFVRLLLKFSCYTSLKYLSDKILTRQIEQEAEIVVNTIIFLLKTTNKEDVAQKIIQRQLENQSSEILGSSVFENFEERPSEIYQKFVTELDITSQTEITSPPTETLQQHQGYVYSYKGKYGFLRDQDEKEYFFHYSAIIDPDLLSKLENLPYDEKTPVTFQLAQGPKGDTIAVNVSAFRTVDEMFSLATRFADEGEYNKAIGQIKKVLAIKPTNSQARVLHEKWREYARVTGVPKGSNPYARAKQVQLIEKNLERAENLFRTAIRQGDNRESAIKDLAMLLDQLERTEEAIKLLEQKRNTISDRQSVDNLLTGLYSKIGSYDEAIRLLNKKLQQAKTSARKMPLLWQIGNAYLRQEKYVQAEKNFRHILRLQPDNQSAERNLAICLFKQERLDEAETILNRILNTSPDTRAAELLDAIKQAKQTGHSGRLDEMIVELTLSELYLSGKVSRFTQFFLDHCQFDGVKPERVQTQKFLRSDIKLLEELATQLRTSRPRQRASYYLSAAKINSILDEGESNQFYKYLCRCFASMGDAAIRESKLSSAQEFYCESLSVYDGDRTKRKGEQDAVNSLVRFLYSTMGSIQVPIKPDIPSVDEALEDVLTTHPEKDKVFDAITYVVSQSRYAANIILKRLYEKEYSLRAMALEYLKNEGIYTAKQINNLSDFSQLWNDLRRKQFDELRTISTEIRFIAGLEFTTASLEVRIEQIKKLRENLFFELDQRRLGQIQNMLEIAFDLCQQEKFGDQERLAEQIERNCLELLNEIESSPTKISIEEMYPVIQTIQSKIKVWKEELYKRSKPDLSLHLPIEAYIPDRNNQLDVQVAVVNRIGCSPAESLELITHPDESLFFVTKTEVKVYSSLEGGDSEIIEIPLRVTDYAISSQAFSLPLYARYRTRSGDTIKTAEYNFSIRLSSEDDFEEINNPYAPYAESGIVEDERMFYGREELIRNIAHAIQNAKTKSVVIYGQKRAGKSSILFHLKKTLQADKHLLVLDWGNIGSIRDKHSQVPLLHQILWGILEKLQFAIEDKVEEGFTPLALSLPTSSLEFYNHPAPLTYFKEIFARYKRQTSTRSSDWQNVRIVLLIDEFTYIFDWILKDEIPDSFMKNWKALLQENYFSAVLVGQDYMPKFKRRFPNEFGTTQDERVTYLRKEDALHLIDEPICIGGRRGESRYREQALETLFSLTAGSPFYIQIVCNRLVEYMNRKRAKFVTEADVKQVKNELITGVNALDIGKFDNLINSGDTSPDAITDTDALEVLKTIALNSRTGLCNRSSIACKTDIFIDTILQDLVNREVIEQRDQNYRIRVELFKEWLTTHR